MSGRSDTISVGRRAPPTSVVVLEKIGVSVFAQTNFSDGSGVDEGVEAENVGRLLTSVNSGYVKEEALGRVVEDHFDDRRVGDNQIFVGSKVVNSTSGRRSGLFAF